MSFPGTVFLLSVLVISACGYIIVSCISCAFGDLSGGRVRKLEETDPDFAAKLDRWLEQETPIRTALKLLLFTFALLIGFALVFPAYAAAGSWNCPFPAVYCCFGFGSVVLICVFFELLSRVFIAKHDLAVLRFGMPPVSLFSEITLSALSPVFRAVEKRAEKWRESAAPEEKATVEDEILDLMEDKPSGDIEEGEKRMIKGIFELQDKSVREIMTPRVDMVAIPLSSTVEEAKQVIVESGHSRIPVYGKSIDEIKGILYAKDFLVLPNDKKTLAGLIRQPIFIPETKAVDELLNEIKRTRNHFAVIIDEYGGTSGIVSFEDIIEEIVGDVFDEYDTVEAEGEKPRICPDGSVEMDARTPLAEMAEILDIDLPDDESNDTIGGYICTHLGRIPVKNEVFVPPEKNFSAAVLAADQRKIQKLKIKVMEHENE